MEYLKTIDYILFVIFMVGGIWGAIKGFIDEIATKFGYVFGLIAAVMFTHLLSPVFSDRFGFPLWFASFVSYFIIFVCGYLLIKIFGSIVSHIVDTANLTFVDNLLGFFLGLIEAFCLFAIIEYMLNMQNLFNLETVLEESLFSSKLILPFAEFCVDKIKAII